MDFQNITDLFSLLQRQAYVILRNYENLLAEEIYEGGHADIDLLCENGFLLAKAIKAKPHPGHLKKGIPDGIHYYITIRGNKVSLDFRSIGDGYYCEKWQKEMLQRRILHNGFYVLEPEDYFYTLLYHAVFQKKELSEEYKGRLLKMSNQLGLAIQTGSTQEWVNLLEAFLKKRGYHYELPADKYVPFRKASIEDNSLFVNHFDRQWKHFFFHSKISLLEWLVKGKQLVFKKGFKER